ncbi:MAG TPA: hypothetical protein VKU01_23990 [Bryobacteraceae bacterium]|nr:hypothetical protein [Bryobacteraceae bacterium]
MKRRDPKTGKFKQGMKALTKELGSQPVQLRPQAGHCPTCLAQLTPAGAGHKPGCNHLAPAQSA